MPLRRAQRHRDGTRCGVRSLSASFIGIEAENTSVANDQPWSEAQLNAHLVPDGIVGPKT
jgi:hypothetical protein